jgi:hypothetical protein
MGSQRLRKPELHRDGSSIASSHTSRKLICGLCMHVMHEVRLPKARLRTEAIPPPMHSLPDCDVKLL